MVMTNPGKTKYDVVIAGGGPAGSSLAIRLATAGMNVLVAEQKSFPRHKLCGEFISPECLPHFEGLGVLPEMLSRAARISETRFFASSGRSVAVPSGWLGQDEAFALGLSRAAMDEVMLRRASEVGVDVRESTTVVDLVRDGETIVGMRLRSDVGNEQDVFARLTVDATGRTRSLERRAERNKKPEPRATQVAFKAHLTGLDNGLDVCEIYSYRGGYGGCNQIEEGLLNLCFIVDASIIKQTGTDPERIMRKVVCSNPRARQTLERTSVATEWLAVPIQTFGRGELAPQPGLVTVGDSAAFIDPFTGSGMLLALQSSEILARSITEQLETGLVQIADDYRAKYSAAIDSRLRWSSILRHASRSTLAAEVMIAGLSLSSSLRRRVARRTRSSAESAT